MTDTPNRLTDDQLATLEQVGAEYAAKTEQLRAAMAGAGESDDPDFQVRVCAALGLEIHEVEFAQSATYTICKRCGVELPRTTVGRESFDDAPHRSPLEVHATYHRRLSAGMAFATHVAMLGWVGADLSGGLIRAAMEAEVDG